MPSLWPSSVVFRGFSVLEGLVSTSSMISAGLDTGSLSREISVVIELIIVKYELL